MRGKPDPALAVPSEDTPEIPDGAADPGPLEIPEAPAPRRFAAGPGFQCLVLQTSSPEQVQGRL